MWIAFALMAAFAFAINSVALKKSAVDADVILSTVVFRFLAALLLTPVALSMGPWPEQTPAYFWTLAVVLPPEVAGMVCLALALRAGDISLVQPILGLIPVFVTVGGIAFLDEIPSAAAALGILLVAAGVYCVGLESGGSLLAPIRALGRSRASWFAVGAALFWSATSVIHKFGIAEVGPLPWAISVTFGSAIVMGALMPFVRRGKRRLPGRYGWWSALMGVAGIGFATHVGGIHTALSLAPAGYVIAVSATSTLIATALGILVFRERSAWQKRAAGAILVTGGAILIAILG